ncbi:MAG: diguanylate cyclase [Firmicutes bacterium]|nr:diguanylate cyclase [Bacillota bacterium]
MYNYQEIMKKRKPVIYTTVALILYMIIYYITLNQDNNQIKIIFSNIMGILGLAISLLIMIYAIKKHTSKNQKKMWRLFAIGIFFFILGDSVWFISESINKLDSYLLITDIFYSIQSVLFVIALYKFAFKKGNPRRIIKSIDILIGSLLIVILELKYIIIPVFSLTINNGISSYLSIIYPVTDLIMLIILIMLVLRPTDKKMIKVTRLIFIPIIINIIIDQIYVFEAIYSNYSSGSMLDPLWPLATWILAIIAIISAEVNIKVTENEEDKGGILGVKQSIRNIIVIVIYVAFIIFGAYVFSRYLIIDVLSVGFLIIVTILIIRDMFYSIKMGKLFEKIKVVNKDLEIVNEKLEVESKTDYMTGLNNRRQIMNIYSKLKKHILKESSILSVIMIDVDNFKNINDQYGHESGDKVLKKVSELLRENIRGNDHVGRFGGEEFMILMPDCDKEKAYGLAERIRLKIESTPINIDNSDLNVNVTISAGISCLGASSNINSDTINEADKALYIAKGNGRNQVIKFNEPSLI